MTTPRDESRRRGGRAERRAIRSQPLAEDLRPIHPGLCGGQYRPLTEVQMQRLHQAALDALENIGLSQAPSSGVAAMTAIGAVLGDDGRLRFPRSLIEDVLAKANRQVTLCGRDNQYDLDLQGQKTYFGTAGAAVHIVDVDTLSYRESTVHDLYEAAKLVQHLDNVHFFQRPMVCRDIADNLEMDLNTIYASCSGTTKHIGTSFSEPHHVAECMKLIHLIAGGEKAWREKPFISNTNCFVVPPMRFATESCETMEHCIRAGMPVLLLSAGQAGATAPAAIATAIVQALAECLAGLVYVHAICPGHPAVFGTWPFVSDLRTGAMSGGSAEQALLSAGCAQMHHFYDLPGGAAAGISDSKLPDMQAGWEQGITNVMAGLSGLNMVYEAVGMHASLLGFCQESLIIGDDIIAQVLRCVRGIDVSEDSVSLETMSQVCLQGPGHYLGSAQTMQLMQTEYVYPNVGNRMSPKEWQEAEKPQLIATVKARKAAILQQATRQITPDVDAQIRQCWSMYFH